MCGCAYGRGTRDSAPVNFVGAAARLAPNPIGRQMSLMGFSPTSRSSGAPGYPATALGFHPIPNSQDSAIVGELSAPPTRTPMTLTSVVLTLIVVGVLLWLVNTFIPMDGKIKQILNAVVVIAVIIWLLYGFGVIGGSGDINLPKIN